MKTVIKKMLSLALVALLLISAAPFQASAAGYVAVDLWVGDEPAECYGELDIEGDSLTLNEAIASIDGFADVEKGDFQGWYICDEDGNPSKQISGNQLAIEDGDELWLAVKYAAPAEEGGDEDDDDDMIIKPGTGDEEEEDKVTDVGGESKPESGTIKCDLTIDYQLSDSDPQTVVAKVGKKYKEYVGVPARGGYEFLGWFSEHYGRIVDVNKDIVPGDDTITALWDDAAQYSLTLDPNRNKSEDVNEIKRVTYGEKIGTLPTPERKGYVFAGWKLNGKIITSNTIWELQGDGTAYAQWKLESDTDGEAMGGNNNHEADGKVYLEIYVNGKTDELVKRVNITDYAKDNKITLKEAKEVVKKYVSAKSGYSLKYEGLFDEESWWWYTRDPETDGEDSVIVNRDGNDYVYIMVKNVKNTTNADKTNPKTGDTIGLAFSIMGMSGAMASALFLNKKRLFK